MSNRRVPALRVVLPALVPILALLAWGTARAQTTVAGGGAVYRLDAASGVQDGCFAPCLCPVLNQDGLLGTFRLTPGAPDPLYQVYDIREVNWLVPGLGWRVTGSGTYKVGGEFALMHELSLDLVVDDRAVAHYDSGLVLGGSGFPAIDLTISMNNMVCHDTVFHVAAKPVLLNEIAPYALYHSLYEEGCFGPCDCAVTAQPVIGRFGLLKLGATPEGAAFAVLDALWSVRAASTLPASDATPVAGYGIYQVGTDGRDQRMVLDLLEDGAGPTRFDSGVVPEHGDLRRIDVDVAADGFACYDRVYSIHAKRRSASVMTFQSIGTEPVAPGVEPVP